MSKKTINSQKEKMRPIDINLLAKMRQPSYHHINRGLTPHATPTEKAKYEVCQSILCYTHEHNISDSQLKKTLGIKENKKLECLLYCHINSFELDELGEYANKLLGFFELKIVRPNEKTHSLNHSHKRL